MDALGINLSGLITQLVSFIILFLILKKVLFGPINKILQTRAKKIQESLEIISNEILDKILLEKANLLDGPTLGLDQIIGGNLRKAMEKEIQLRGAIVRKAAKEHGTGKQIEGMVRATDKAIIVDDTCTTGKSILMAAKIVEKQGCTIAGIICVVDRDEGGKQNIEKQGYKFNSLLKVENHKLIPYV